MMKADLPASAKNGRLTKTDGNFGGFMIGKLKEACTVIPGKIFALILAITILMLSVNSYIYDNNVQVNISIDGVTVKTISTKADTVSSILEDEKIIVFKSDEVVPSPDTKVLEDSTIMVKRLKNVVISDGEEVHQIKTTAITTEELGATGVLGVTEKDTILPSGKEAHGAVFNGGTYVVKRAYPIEVHADGAIYPVEASYGTVRDIVKASGISLSENDIVSPELGVQISEDMEINVTRVARVHTSENEKISYDIDRIPNAYLKAGEEVVTVEGSEGEKIVNRIITYHDGVMVSDESYECVVREPENRVIECGVWRKPKAGINSGEAIGTIGGYNYSKVISAKATAYCDKGLTASGIHSQVGVVAVDPRVIPLGSKLYIEAVDGSWSYGLCLAGDTGGLIKGKRVDLFYDEYDTCMQFGRRACNIYVLSE